MEKERGFVASAGLVQEGMVASVYSSVGSYFHGKVVVDQKRLGAALEIHVVGAVPGDSVARVVLLGDP